jgi:K(+)-stimulated pyrophosphate-energized sodium pump
VRKRLPKIVPLVLMLAAFVVVVVTAAFRADAADTGTPSAGTAASGGLSVETKGWIAWGIGIACALVALLFAYIFFKGMMKASEGTETMREIARHVREGANAYLRRQYSVVAIVFVFLCLFLVFLAFGLGVQHRIVPFAFLTGGFFSGLCGWLGMKTATYASARTTEAARHSLDRGLRVAFRSGAVMGLVVVGFGLLDISLWFVILKALVPALGFKPIPLSEITVIMLTFGMGASTQALFARVGGGIFTKAADVGADLVGKVEAGIPEDDPRNPATIADNVGDNVGDVAGMGADLYESYCGSILATAALATAAHLDFSGVIVPMVIAGVGILLSVLGAYLVRTKEGASMKQLMGALNVGLWVSSAGIGVVSFIAVWLLLGLSFWGVWAAVAVGLVAGLIIGKSTEYYTSMDYGPTRGIARQSATGPATVIIEGISTGMLSTWMPIVTISIGILVAFGLAGGFTDLNRGLYGIGLAAVGMLSTLGFTLATDAYGPIADNAGGNAEMSGLGPEVRKRTDALDSLGNTTAATGKGFAIGSAALTALALLAAYIEEVKIGLVRVAGKATAVLVPGLEKTADQIRAMTFENFMEAYNVTLMNPVVLVGIFSGVLMVFVFCALAMKAVGRAAGRMVEEVRRQFHEKPGIMEGTDKPDYARCVRISTVGAQKEMIFPSMLALVTPVVIGILLGPAGVLGLLAGGLTCGFAMAVYMANAGGAWDNAKKYIETGQLGGKGSANHKASIVGDTVGDPFKDTSGPSLNILIKLVSMVSVVVAGLTVKLSPIIQGWLRMR